ncbi:dynamin family protein [Roseobacter sp. YSTF-M11]|uniref:Dynamin family protein n=1 Tax=Roseobacter insulae TaxID=2859783 RepID=A0A9X1K0B6_9RHOB|nr:dynamin family protein [Roseobacter insulae]MBW4710085.1 dynamin family protein [Roseobacter insulae]
MTLDNPPAEVPAYVQNLPGPRRPRIALMGEFSAGKSTLANLMIGSDPLPVQVIATQLPPVWISYGSAPAVIVDLDGNETPCDLESLQEIPTEQTAFIRIQSKEEILRMCDVIDMPGISDPNMAASVWERILPLADGVIWCSPATQAWRQSEASVWEKVPPHIQEHSLLLLTRGDMLVSEKDRKKVLKRVRSEAEDLFAQCLMMSLTQARDAEDDPDLWDQSGAEPFVNEFLNIISVLTDRIARDAPTEPFVYQGCEATEAPEAVPSDEASPQTERDDRIVPRRPVVKATRPRPAPRPEPEEEESLSPKFS